MIEITGRTDKYKLSQMDCFWNMLCMSDENIQKLHPSDIQNKNGVYVFFDRDDNIIRIGKAVKLRNRIMSYAARSNWYIFKDMQEDINSIGVIYLIDESESAFVEIDLIKHNKPKYNIQGV